MRIDPDEAWTVLADLLTGRHGEEQDDQLPGAEMIVADSGREVFRAALARHARREDTVLWVRPLVSAGTDPSTGMPAFDLQLNRRRVLDVAEAQAENGRLELMLTTGQTAVIQPASGPQLGVLADFDSWLAMLPADVVARIDQLEDDTEMA